MPDTGATRASGRPRVLITRPRDRQADFARRCRDIGFDVSRLPCVEIVWSEGVDLAPLASADLVIFTSVYAVTAAHRLMPLPWPGTATVAIGPATRQALTAHGQTIAFDTPAPHTSEALLTRLGTATAAGHTAIARTVIVKGVGGRDLLRSTLETHGHPVETLDVYRRHRPVIAEETLTAIVDEPVIDILSVTSNELLDNLLALIGPQRQSRIRQLPVVVNSHRGAEHARKQGFVSSILTADPPGDEGQIRQLQAWRNGMAETPN